MSSIESTEKDRAAEAIQGGRNGSLGAIGSYVWWGSWKASIRPGDLRDLARKHGLPEGLLPEEPSPEKAFRRAALAVQAREEMDDYIPGGKGGGKGVGRMARWTVRPVKADGIEITYGIRQERRDLKAGRVDAIQEARISWFPSLGRVLSDSPRHPMVRRILDELPHYQTSYVTDDVTELVNRVMAAAGAVSMAGVRINSRFVPASGHGLLDSLTEVLKGVSGTTLDVVTVYDDPRSLETVQRISRTALEGDIGGLEAELETFRTKLGEGGIVRGSTLLNRCEELAELGERVESLAGQLRFKADDLSARIDATREGLVALIS